MKALVIIKTSIYEFYSQSDDDKVRAYATADTPCGRRLQNAHRILEESKHHVLAGLAAAGVDVTLTARGSAEKYCPFTDFDVVITVGGDGTFLEAAHYITRTPVLPVNGNPESSVGFYTVVDAPEFAEYFTRFNRLPRTELRRMGVWINGEKMPVLAVNDVLFAHAHPASTTRYSMDGQTVIKGSGLLISTPSGSTGWIYYEGGEQMDLSRADLQVLHRGTRRPPFFSDTFEIISHNRSGYVYLDGEHVAFPCTLGDRLYVAFAEAMTVAGTIGRRK